MTSFDLKLIDTELEKAVEFLQKSLSQIRTSRATPALVENLKVELNGAQMTIKQLASISCPQANQIVIQPWTEDYIMPIEKAISQSEIGFRPIVDQKIIRINLPPLSEERREELSHLIKEKVEEVRQTIRHWWDEGWGKIQEDFSAKLIDEDTKFKLKDELHKLVETYSQKMEDLKKSKIKEIMEK